MLISTKYQLNDKFYLEIYFARLRLSLKCSTKDYIQRGASVLIYYGALWCDNQDVKKLVLLFFPVACKLYYILEECHVPKVKYRAVCCWCTGFVTQSLMLSQIGLMTTANSSNHFWNDLTPSLFRSYFDQNECFKLLKNKVPK